MEEWDKNEEDIRKLMVEMTEMRDKPHSAEWKTLKARLAVAVWKHAEKLYKEVKVIKTNNDEKKEYRGVVSDCGVEMMEELHSIFSCIQQIWEDSQERTQDYLSALVTRQILSENRFISDAKLVPELRQYGFCDANILEQYLEDKLPLQEAVAEQFCRHKTDASRTMRHFQEKLTDLLKMKANLST